MPSWIGAQIPGWRGHLADISRPRLTPPPHTFIQQAFPPTYPVPAPCWRLLLRGTLEPFQTAAPPPGPGPSEPPNLTGLSGSRTGVSPAFLTPVKRSPSLLRLPRESSLPSTSPPPPQCGPVWPPRVEGRAWELGPFLIRSQHWAGDQTGTSGVSGLAWRGSGQGCSPEPPRFCLPGPGGAHTLCSQGIDLRPLVRSMVENIPPLLQQILSVAQRQA